MPVMPTSEDTVRIAFEETKALLRPGPAVCGWSWPVWDG